MDLGDGYAGSSKELIDGTVAQWTHNVLRTAEVLGQGNGAVPVILGEFVLDTSAEGTQDYVHLVYQTADAAGTAEVYLPFDSEPRINGAEVVSWDAASGILEVRIPDAGSVLIQR